MCYYAQAQTQRAHIGMKRNEFGFLLVNFKRLFPLHEQPFVFTLQVEHVFFSKSTYELGWRVVLMKGPRFQKMATDNAPIDDQLSSQRPDTIALVDATNVGMELNEKPFQNSSNSPMVEDLGMAARLMWAWLHDCPPIVHYNLR
jgi:hypothetical protein